MSLLGTTRGERLAANALLTLLAVSGAALALWQSL